MNRSNIWFASILIASALLLSGASGSAASPGVTATPSKPPPIQSREPQSDDHGQIDKRNPPQMIESPFETKILEAVRAIVSQQQSAREQDQANEERWWPPSPSWAIVYVTVAYVIVAAYQWVALRKTVNKTQTLVDTADRQAKAAEDQVGKLADTLIATQIAASAAKKSADTSERALVDVERPHILIEGPTMHGFKTRIPQEEEALKHLDAFQKVNQPRILTITYRTKNHGKGPAWIRRSVVRFVIAVPRLEVGPDYGNRIPEFFGYALPAGESRDAERMFEGNPLTEDWRLRIVKGNAELVVLEFSSTRTFLPKRLERPTSLRLHIGMW